MKCELSKQGGFLWLIYFITGCAAQCYRTFPLRNYFFCFPVLTHNILTISCTQLASAARTPTISICFAVYLSLSSTDLLGKRLCVLDRFFDLKQHDVIARAKGKTVPSRFQSLTVSYILNVSRTYAEDPQIRWVDI